jgi:AraC-like DNA-binding protein
VVWIDDGGRQRDLGLIAPTAALHDVVEHFWIQGLLPKQLWRVVPDLSAHVIVSITSASRGLSASCFVVGARSQYCDINVAGRGLTIGARLRPGALPHLLRDSASQLTDRTVALDRIVGRAALTLVERMSEARQPEALRLFAEFLSERLDSARPPLPQNLIRSATSVTDLARALSLSRRGVYDRLSATVGLPPKLALRIHRLHRALFALNTGVSPSDAAATAAYCDQAHFTREATCLLGETPGAWVRRGCSILQDRSSRRER